MSVVDMYGLIWETKEGGRSVGTPDEYLDKMRLLPDPQDVN
jgi:hypothetical protein